MRVHALLWLACGVFLRLLWLGQPPVEDNSWIRQTQTADAIQSWVEAGHPSWDAGVSWRGDTGARLVQELPLYNLLVYGAKVAGIPLNAAGRLLSAVLWGVGFLLVQKIWQRWLNPRETFWANLLFVLSPGSIAFGQAIMPEMLVQLLGIGFVVLLFRYRDQPSLALWWGIVAVGILGVLVKLPGFSHYYLLLACGLVQAHGAKGLISPRVWLGAGFTLAALWIWSRYTQSVNAAFFPEWTARANLQGFLGRWEDRFQPVYWVRLFFYLLVLVGTPAAWLTMLFGRGGWTRDGWNAPLLVAWLGGLGLMVLVWGPRTCMGHAYYCLPFLAPTCAIFGKSAGSVLTQGSRPAWLAFLLAAGILAGCLPMAAYLLRPDSTLRETADWMQTNIPPTDLVIIKANHSDYTREYPELPGFSYLSGRKVWIWTPHLAPKERERAVQTSRWIVETRPLYQLVWWERVREKIKGHQREPEDITPLLAQQKAILKHQTPRFRVFQTSQGR